MLPNDKTVPAPSAHCMKFLDFLPSDFDALDEHAARDLAATTLVVHYRVGATILAQGEPADRIGMISSGTVKVVDMTEDGTAHLLCLLAPGDIVGDITTIENQFAWEAATDVTMCMLTLASFERLLSDHISFQRSYLAATLRQLAKERLWASSMRSKGAMQRVAALLFAQLPQDDCAAETLLPMALSRRDIAALLNMSVETLCRALHQMKDAGTIRMLKPDLLVVQRPEMLLAIAKGAQLSHLGGMLRAPAAQSYFLDQLRPKPGMRH